MIANTELVTDIKTCKTNDILTVTTQGGTKNFNEEVDLKLLPLKVHVKKKSLANILSLKDVSSIPGVRVTMYTFKEHAIPVDYKGKMLKFEECGAGLCFLDMDELLNHSKESVNYYNFVQTVQKNKESYTQREIQQTIKARKTQRLVGWPGTDTFKRYIVNNIIESVGITINDIVNGENIYGEQRQLLQGKMTRAKANGLEHTRLPVPAPILETHKQVHIEMDNIFVNGLHFFYTKSRNVNYQTIDRLKARTKRNIINACIKTNRIYDARGLEITDWYGDNEFDMEDLKDELSPAHKTTCAANEHIGSIEREAWTHKERARCSTHDLP